MTPCFSGFGIFYDTSYVVHVVLVYLLSIVPGKFRPVNIRLASQSLTEAVRVVLSSCDLPLDYIDKHSASAAAAKSNNPFSSDVSRVDFTNIRSHIITRFYGAHAYDQSPLRMRRMARNTLW